MKEHTAMKRFIRFCIVLLLTMASVMSAYPQVSGEAVIPDTVVTVRNEGGYDHILVDLPLISAMQEVGAPQLPVHIATYVLPFNAEVTGLQVYTGTHRKIEGNYLIYPAQPPLTVNAGDTVVFVEPDSAVYNSAAPYPGRTAEIISDRYEQGYHVVTVASYPVEYRPLSRELYITDISYAIGYTMGSGTRVLQAEKQSARRAELNKRAIKALVQNPEAVENSASPTTQIVHRTTKIDTTIMQARSNSVLDELVPDYIIITNNELKPVFQKLADWKTQKGLPAVIKTVEEITPDYPGCDTQEKIRNYLKDAYSHWGAGLFVLLGGDVNIVPARERETVDTEKKGIFYPTDLYYTALEGTWNANRNNIFGEEDDDVDYGRKVYLGRASVEDSVEANTFIDKVLGYEKAQGMTNQNYFNNSLVADAFLTKNGITGQLAYISKNSIKNICTKYLPIRTKLWFMVDNHDCKLENCYDANCVEYNEELTRLNFLSALNGGGNSGYGPFHFVYHMDHSTETGLGTSSYMKNESMSRGDAGALSNGSYYHIFFSGGCNPANFSKDCIAERLLENPNGGAVAFISNTDVGKVYEWDLLQGFLNALYDTQNYPSAGRYDIGYAYQRALLELARKDNWRLHLLGDPEMQVWTDVPKTIQLSLERHSSDTLKVIVGGVTAGDEILLCIQKNNEVYATETIAGNGSFNFQLLSSGVPGDITVTATGHNYLPAVSVYSEETIGNSTVRIHDITVIDNNTVTCRGNGDGQADAGEIVELEISLKNTGDTLTSDVTGVLWGLSPYISVVNDQVQYGAIASGQEKIPEQKFRIAINKDAPEIWENDLNPVRFRLEITYENGTSSAQEFNIPIFSTELEQGNKSIEATNLNGDKIIEPGETVYFRIALTNTGKAQAVGISASVSVDSLSMAYIFADTSSVAYPVIGKNETRYGNGVHSVTVSNNYVSGMPVNLCLHLCNAYGKTWDYTFDLADRPLSCGIEEDSLRFVSGETQIELIWVPDLTLKGYDIYRSQSGIEAGYVKINTYPVEAAYFRDEGLERLTKYYYKIKKVAPNGNESDFSEPFLAWTSYPTTGLFPIRMEMDDSNKSKSGPVIVDLDGDGEKEFFSTMTSGDTGKESYLLAFKHDGEELFDIDGNLTSKSGFSVLEAAMLAAPAVGKLRGDNEYQVVALTRDLSPDSTRKNYIACYAVKDTTGDGKPDLLWQKEVSRTYYCGAVIANIDNSSDGTEEIVLVSDGNAIAPVEILDAAGNIVRTIGTEKGTYGAAAVADLDGDGDKEIIVGYVDGLYVWHHNGTPYAANPLCSAPTGYLFNSTPVVCDLDGDGQKEILLPVRDDTGGRGTLFAFKRNGTALSGWNGTQNIYYNRTVAPVYEISVGDLDNDGSLEVVALGVDTVKVWDNQGGLISSIYIPGLIPGRIAPILADVDGDEEAEIIFGSTSGKSIYGVKTDGSYALGFPLAIEGVMEASVAVADLDGDGKNEVVAVSEGQVYMWKTDGSPSRIEWGMARFDHRNSGEYNSPCPAIEITSDTEWSTSENFCGNLDVRSGTLTIAQNGIVSMTPGRKITVYSGAGLVIDGGQIENAEIFALSGSTVILKNNGKVKLGEKGRFSIVKGALFHNQYGSVER